MTSQIKLDGEYQVIHISNDLIILQDTNGGRLDGPLFSIRIEQETIDTVPALVLNTLQEKPLL